MLQSITTMTSHSPVSILRFWDIDLMSYPTSNCLTTREFNLQASNIGANPGLSAADLQALILALRAGHTTTAPVQSGSNALNPTTVDQRWAINLPSLLKFCMVQLVSQLTPVWDALAKGPKKEERTILQSALNDHSRTPGAATTAHLTVTKELLSTVVGLVFWSGDLDMLDEGLHPFCTLYTSTAKQAQDQARFRVYDSLAQEGTLRLEDVELFQLMLWSHWPSDYRQLDTSLKFFHNLISVLFLMTHPLVAAHKSFLDTWRRLDIQLAEYFASDQAKPALFLCSVQLRIASYWHQVSLATDWWWIICHYQQTQKCHRNSRGATAGSW